MAGCALRRAIRPAPVSMQAQGHHTRMPGEGGVERRRHKGRKSLASPKRLRDPPSLAVLMYERPVRRPTVRDASRVARLEHSAAQRAAFSQSTDVQQQLVCKLIYTSTCCNQANLMGTQGHACVRLKMQERTFLKSPSQLAAGGARAQRARRQRPAQHARGCAGQAARKAWGRNASSSARGGAALGRQGQLRQGARLGGPGSRLRGARLVALAAAGAPRSRQGGRAEQRLSWTRAQP